MVGAAAKVGGGVVGDPVATPNKTASTSPPAPQSWVKVTAVDVGSATFKPLPPLPPPTRALAKAVAPLLPRAVVAALDPRRGGARCLSLIHI